MFGVTRPVKAIKLDFLVAPSWMKSEWKSPNVYPSCLTRIEKHRYIVNRHNPLPTNHPVIVREQYKTLHPPTAFLITLYPNTDQISFPPAQNIDLTFPCPRRPTLSFNQRPQIAIPAQSHLSRPHQLIPFRYPFSKSTQLSTLKPFIRPSPHLSSSPPQYRNQYKFPLYDLLTILSFLPSRHPQPFFSSVYAEHTILPTKQASDSLLTLSSSPVYNKQYTTEEEKPKNNNQKSEIQTNLFITSASF